MPDEMLAATKARDAARVEFEHGIALVENIRRDADLGYQQLCARAEMWCEMEYRRSDDLREEVDQECSAAQEVYYAAMKAAESGA